MDEVGLRANETKIPLERDDLGIEALIIELPESKEKRAALAVGEIQKTLIYVQAWLSSLAAAVGEDVVYNLKPERFGGQVAIQQLIELLSGRKRHEKR